MQSDPIGLAGGLNTFTYVYNNPLYWIDVSGLWPDFLDKIRKKRGKTTYDAHKEQHPIEHEEMFGRVTKKGMNRLDRKIVNDVTNKAGIPKEFRRQFGDYIEKLKTLEGREGANNFSWDELMNIAKEFKEQYCP